MKNFFSRMEPWRKPEGSLHLYALPDEDERERLFTVQEALSGIDGLPLMPPAYLHCTVTRLAQFDEDVTQVQYTQLGDALQELCTQLSPFSLDFGAPRAGEDAVGCWAAESRSWDALVEGCRRTVFATWGLEPHAPPVAPHLSLAYARASVDTDLVTARLTAAQPLGAVRVQTLHLVSVTVRPERGTFDFTELANWDLGS
ncbi:MAG: 2'-5' RNA ligase family protein [Arachnia sp.]